MKIIFDYAQGKITPAELEQMVKDGKLNPKTLKQIKKAFEGRDLGTKGRKC